MRKWAALRLPSSAERAVRTKLSLGHHAARARLGCNPPTRGSASIAPPRRGSALLAARIDYASSSARSSSAMAIPIVASGSRMSRTTTFRATDANRPAPSQPKA